MSESRIVLQTERLLLRELVAEDLDFLADMLANPEVMRFYPQCLNRVEAQAWLERQFVRYRDFGHGFWLVAERATGRPVGQVGLLLQEVADQPEYEIGYMIHRPYWRRGYAFEAAHAVRRQAYEERGLTRIISLVRPENIPSLAVASKLGAVIEREVLFKDLRHLVFVHPPGST